MGSTSIVATFAVVAALALVAWGLRRHRPATAGAWVAVAAGRPALLFAAIVVAAPDATERSQAIGIGIGIVGYACTAVGLVGLARHLSRVWDRTRWIDAIVVSAAVGATATALLMGTDVADGASWTERWILPAYPALDLLMVLLAVRCLLAVQERSRSLRLLTVGLALQLLADIAATWLAPLGVDVPAATAAVGVGLASLVIAAAAATASVAVTPSRMLPWRRLGSVRFTVLVTSLVLPLAALVLLAARGSATTATTVHLALSATALGVLVLVRVSGLVTYADSLADERHRSRFEALAVHSHDAVVILDGDGTISWASPAVRTVLGPSEAEVVGHALDALLGPTTAADLDRSFDHLRQLGEGATMQVQAAIVDAEGHERSIEGVATNLLADAAVAGLVLVVRDITERTAMQRQLEQQAFVDPLTGLANRALFVDRVGHALSRASRGDDHRAAVLFIDLDDFKAVNDSLGHGRGDDLLAVIGRRIADALRPSDTAARLGGDEFAVLVEDADLAEAMAVAHRILDLLAVPSSFGDLTLAVTASIGVAHADDPGVSVAVLLRNADLAMYEAKREGKGQVRPFRSELHERELRQFTMRSDLHAALDRGELRLVYQPIVDLATEAIDGAEVLLRWEHPAHGLVSPLDFIPLAEATKAIVPIGRWVLREACEQVARWEPALGRLTIDVNVSAVQLLEPGYVDDVASILASTGVDPSQVVLELTESILVHDADLARSVLHDLRALGVGLAIDDFGTGYSSLAYLQNFPIDIVKIDKAFVDQLGQDGRGQSLARSIVTLATSLGIDTIAEGIETAEQAADLDALRCARGQGYYFGRPLAPAAFAELVTEMASPSALSITEL